MFVVAALYLLRHGQTEWTVSGRHTGRTDVPLTPEGERRARAAGRLLRELRGDTPPALVLSSPRRRALRSAELAGLTVTDITEEVAEWDYGDYEGLTTPEIREHVPGWRVWTHPTPGGETAEAVGTRATRVVHRVRAALPAGDAIIVGHGHFSRVLIATWIAQPPSFGVHFGLEPGAVTVLGEERGAPQVVRLNLPPIDP
ncbi:MAG TPA: histidine phosphatase family protein [Actinophytocola sp.]|uniref:histidine phosphatase family protein n=1 Tax=Actinophytocola sp. TaxID=1872138 RepID=UPI002DBC1078|nr:histidine phosphatase family protein [Actinophytocola sp.]HEU5473743.1 histidine phosphatase family protein [Actinophytocola sp.]